MSDTPKRLMEIHNTPEAAATSGITNEDVGKHASLDVPPLLGPESFNEDCYEIRSWALIVDVVRVGIYRTRGAHRRHSTVSQDEEPKRDFLYHPAHAVDLWADDYTTIFVV